MWMTGWTAGGYQQGGRLGGDGWEGTTGSGRLGVDDMIENWECTPGSGQRGG